MLTPQIIEDLRSNIRPHPKPSPKKIYSEIIVVTILSLVAASLWIEWSKGFIQRHFPNNPSALLACALTVSLLAVCGLQIIFKKE